MELAAPSPFALLPPRGSRRGGTSVAPAGTADLPSAVPVSLPRKALIENLRRSIEAIERPSLGASDAMPSGKGGASCKGPLWRFDCDGAVPLPALEVGCVHEVKPRFQSRGASAGDWMASLGFSLRLAVRRLAQVAASGEKGRLILWCTSRAFTRELGHLSWHGLSALGLDPAQFLIVETACQEDALAALEEGLRSPMLALGIGIFENVELNPARRLSLAAGVEGIPCLIATHPAHPPAAATATRWRIGREKSATHPFDSRAPGLARFAVTLDRCRSLPAAADRPPFILEWCDETRTFRLAPLMADHAPQARGTGRCAGA